MSFPLSHVRIPALAVLLLAAAACGGGGYSAGRGSPYDIANSVIILDLDRDGRPDLAIAMATWGRSEEHTSELQSQR